MLMNPSELYNTNELKLLIALDQAGELSPAALSAAVLLPLPAANRVKMSSHPMDDLEDELEDVN